MRDICVKKSFFLIKNITSYENLKSTFYKNGSCVTITSYELRIIYYFILFNLQQERVKMLICVALPLKIYFSVK